MNSTGPGMIEIRALQIVVAPSHGTGFKVGIGGPERRAGNLIHQWKEYGIRPIVAYPRRGNLWQQFARSGVQLVDLEIGSKLNLRASWAIADLARQYDAQLIHTQGPASLDMLACLGGRLVGVPVVRHAPQCLKTS